MIIREADQTRAVSGFHVSFMLRSPVSNVNIHSLLFKTAEHFVADYLRSAPVFTFVAVLLFTVSSNFTGAHCICDLY